MSKWMDRYMRWARDWYEVDDAGLRVIMSCDDGTSTQYAFEAAHLIRDLVDETKGESK